MSGAMLPLLHMSFMAWRGNKLYALPHLRHSVWCKNGRCHISHLRHREVCGSTYEVLMPMSLKIQVLWDVKPCPLGNNVRRFEGS